MKTIACISLAINNNNFKSHIKWKFVKDKEGKALKLYSPICIVASTNNHYFLDTLSKNKTYYINKIA